MTNSLMCGPHDLEAFFKDRGSSLRCPFCGTDDWELESMDAMGDPPKNETFIYKISGKTYSLKQWRGRPVLLLTCANCGFLRMQDTKKFFKWCDNQGENK